MRYFNNFLFFYKTLRYRLFIRMFMGIGVGLLDGFGLAMFLPLLQMADGHSANGSEHGMGNLSFLIHGMNYLGLSVVLTNVLLVLAVFFVLKGLASYLNGAYDVNLQQLFIRTLRINLTKALSRMSYKSYVVSDVGRIQNTMTGEVVSLVNAFQAYSNAFQQGILVTVYMLFAFFVDAKFALLICLGGLITNLLYKRIYQITKRTSNIITTGANLYQGLIIQFSGNFKYLKATGSIFKYNKKLIQSINSISKETKKVGKLGVLINSTREPLLILVVCLVILIQVKAMGGSMTSILISLLFFYRALSSLLQMQSAYNSFLGASGSIVNMKGFEKELATAEEEDGAQEVKRFEDEISLANASFAYVPDSYAVSNINLEVKKNETIAFVGESGSGKTTLVNILVGLLPVSNGRMYVNGINRSEIKISSYQKRIGYITQDPVIFNDTVFNNVTFWDDVNAETLRRFERAIELASIADFVHSLPRKEGSTLEHNGINLSGGQKQRISIARELYKDIDILVLDEATSALDSETERAIQNSIEALKGKYTVLIVAHRLSTIKNVDRIVIMDKGEIVDEGSFTGLVNSSRKFKRMVELQEI
jgi:ABC-type multidrug transport system fused ATPase/permease subunit